MPTRPPTLCPTCRHPYLGAYCACTPRPAGKPRPRGRRWSALRLQKLRADPFCQWPGCATPAMQVDHITPVSEGGAWWEWTNLQSLCIPHHRVKTATEARRRLARIAYRGGR